MGTFHWTERDCVRVTYSRHCRLFFFAKFFMQLGSTLCLHDLMLQVRSTLNATFNDQYNHKRLYLSAFDKQQLYTHLHQIKTAALDHPCDGTTSKMRGEVCADERPLRIVIKVGTSSICNEKNQHMLLTIMASMVETIVKLRSD